MLYQYLSGHAIHKAAAKQGWWVSEIIFTPHILKAISIFHIHPSVWPWEMIDVFLWQLLVTEPRETRGAAVSEHACLKYTELHLPTTQTQDRSLSIKHCVRICVCHCWLMYTEHADREYVKSWMILWTTFEMWNSYIFIWPCCRYCLFLIAL